MFKETKRNRNRMKTEPLLITEKGQCFSCGKQGYTHKHHIFGAANRDRSEAAGLYIYLCPACHQASHTNRKIDLKYKRAGQMAWMVRNEKKTDDFIQEFGKSYLFWE